MNPLTKARIKFCLFEEHWAIEFQYTDPRLIGLGEDFKHITGNGKPMVINTCGTWGAGITPMREKVSPFSVTEYRFSFPMQTPLLVVTGWGCNPILIDLFNALIDWAKNWEGWANEPAITPKITDDFGNDIDLSNYTGSVVVLEV